MKPTVHQVAQGTDEWHLLRATSFNASEAAAMMNVSPYMTRGELLRAKHTAKETGHMPQQEGNQFIFDKGHKAEAEFRPIAEEMIGQELFPATMSIDLDGMQLLASMDGITFDGVDIYESKLFNNQLAQHIDVADEPPETHYWQLEHQLLVSGAKRVLFVTSDGTKDNCAYCTYESQPKRRAALIAGWKQFQADLEAYVPVNPVDKPVAKLVATLPVVFDMRVEGRLVSCNLEAYKPAALAYIEKINTELTTDQDFADADADAKFCRESADKLKLAIEQALGQMGDINAALSAVKDIAAAFDAKGLALEKLVKSRKQAIKDEVIGNARTALAQHIQHLNERIGGKWMPVIAADFDGAAKNKRNLDSLRDAVDGALAQAKLKANEVADLIQLNRKALTGEAHDWEFLFPDFAAVGTKPQEDFANLLAQRIQAHKDAEEKRRQAEAAARQAVETVAVAPTPAPAASEPAKPQARAAAVTPTRPALTSLSRPTDEAIVGALALHFRVHESKVLEWLAGFDHTAANQRLAKEFA